MVRQRFDVRRRGDASSIALRGVATEPHSGESPADHLPPHIERLTSFGERADWSHDGKKLLFLSKTFGDAMELDVATRSIRNLTAHYPHHGYTRALYLANGDILLAGPQSFDPRKLGEARWNCCLYVLDKSRTKPAAPLGPLQRRARRVAQAVAHRLDRVGRRRGGRQLAKINSDHVSSTTARRRSRISLPCSPTATWSSAAEWKRRISARRTSAS